MSFQVDILRSSQKFNMQIKIIFLYNYDPVLEFPNCYSSFILTA